MPYVQETIKAGNVVEVTKYYSSRYHGPKIYRNKNFDKTTLDQKKINEKNSIKKLRLLIMENFVAEDIRIDLTYEEPQPEPMEAKKRFDRFLRKIRDLYGRLGHALKWIGVTEYQGHRIHHHVLINNVGIGRKELNAAWPYCKIDYKRFRFYDGGPDDAQRVARYFVKETKKTYCQTDCIQRQRWRASRNLRKPEVKKEIIPRNGWKDEPKAQKGYYIQQPVETGYTAWGYPYQQYRMIREEPNDHTKKGNRDVHHKKRAVGVQGYQRRTGKCHAGKPGMLPAGGNDSVR